MRCCVAALALFAALPALAVENLEAGFQQAEVEYKRIASDNLRRRLQGEMPPTPPMLCDFFGGEPGFFHSVASGDPLSDAVIIWTRYTPCDAEDVVDIEFRIAKVDPDLPFEDHLTAANPYLKSGIVTTDGTTDWVVKLDIKGLDPYTQYVYAFTDGSISSDVGLTKTAPAADAMVDDVTYAVFSCSNFPNGYFHAYDIASTIEGLDIWIHTGDYLYEYGEWQTWARDSTERWEIQEPKYEIVELNDYRRRHATYVGDEGLQNLRRSAPMVASWDDHEITNNPYTLADGSEAGAQNHQPECPVGRDSDNDDPSAYRANYCDRNEGEACPRWNRAFQSYLEWLPLRKGEGRMGCVLDGTITQIIEWGKLASFATFDTRISGRSADQTLRSVFGMFGELTGPNTDVTEYETTMKSDFMDLKERVEKMFWDPAMTQISDENMALLEQWMIDSAEAGKPWQIWAANTMFGDHTMTPLDKLHEYIEDPGKKAALQAVMMDGLSQPGNAFPRTMAAMCQTKTSWNSDGWSGVSMQRAQILSMAERYANNFVVLGGDVHDSWSYVMKHNGEPVAVNLICSGVTSPSPWAGAIYPLIEPLESMLGGKHAVFDLVEQGFVDCIDTESSKLVYGSIARRGFFAVKATEEVHTTEYLLIDPENIVKNFTTAREDNGDGLTAEFVCDSSLATFADAPGSLVPRGECGAITFMDSRPAVFDLPVPSSFVSSSAMLEQCGYHGCVVDTCIGKRCAQFMN